MHGGQTQQFCSDKLNMRSLNPEDKTEKDLVTSRSKSKRSLITQTLSPTKKPSALVSLDSILPNGHHYFVQYNQLLELYEDFSGQQFLELLKALNKEFPEIVALDKNHRVMKRKEAEDLMQFSQLLETYTSVQSTRFSVKLTYLIEKFPDLVPIGNNIITRENIQNGKFLQYSQLLDLFEKKQCFEFTRRLRAISEEYLQIVPIDYNHQEVFDLEESKNQFLQYAEIFELYDELSGSQFTDLLKSLAQQFPSMIPIGHNVKNAEQEEEKSPIRSPGKLKEKTKKDDSSSLADEAQEVVFKQYKDILDMYKDYNGVTFVKKLNSLHKKYPQIVPSNWKEEDAQNKHFLQYEELIEVYLQVSGSQFVELMEGLIKQYPEIVPVGQQNIRQEISEFCKFLQYGEILELHSELSGDQFKEKLQGIAGQYPQIVCLTSRYHVNINSSQKRANFVQFTQLSELYSSTSGPHFRQLLRRLSHQYPQIAPAVEVKQNTNFFQIMPQRIEMMKTESENPRKMMGNRKNQVKKPEPIKKPEPVNLLKVESTFPSMKKTGSMSPVRATTSRR